MVNNNDIEYQFFEDTNPLVGPRQLQSRELRPPQLGRVSLVSSRLTSKCSGCCEGLRKVSWSFSCLLLVFFLLLGIGCITSRPIVLVLIIVAGWLVGVALHEFGHALTAYYGGDSSVVDKGYLTLDLLHYADPVMTFLIPTLILLYGGLALPGGAVSITPSNLRSKLWATYVALAGPLTNFLFGVVLALSLQLWSTLPVSLTNDSVICPSLSLLVFFQVMATVLNLLPLPGLDGWSAIAPWLPESCFINRWMSNYWQSRSICMVSFLLIFLAVQYFPPLTFMIVAVTGLFGLDYECLTRGYELMSSGLRHG